MQKAILLFAAVASRRSTLDGADAGPEERETRSDNRASRGLGQVRGDTRAFSPRARHRTRGIAAHP